MFADGDHINGDWKELKVRGQKNLQQKRRSLRSALEVLSSKKESMMGQKAKIKWLREGNCNTKFFHSLVSHRRSKNVINRIERVEGCVTYDLEVIQNQIISFFQNYMVRQTIEGGGLRV